MPISPKSSGTAAAIPAGQVATPGASRQRDVRLDFFRGIGMFIIFIAHVPYNAWTNYIPARFGFSDATEIFVFCSGMASAIAFGRLFEERGFKVGATRIAYRCWQVYWAHISIFMLVAASMVLADKWLARDGAYLQGLNLVPFLSGDTGTNLVGLLTLTYVPNFFDILPMYLVILAMIPIVMALKKLGRAYVFAAILATWFFATLGWINLPAEPWSDRVWFFNPFAWQLVFFTGFVFIRGWLPAPPISRPLMIAAALFVAAVIPFHHTWFLTNVPFFNDARNGLGLLVDKTGFGLLRYVHFLAIAYLAYALAGPNGDNIRTIKGPFVAICCKVGQQALGVFLAGQLLSMLGGIYLNELGHTYFNTALVNFTGFALLIAVAYIAAYFKSSPWKGHKHATALPAQPAPSGAPDRSAAGTGRVSQPAE
ncbi:MAG: OpgC domain-containing protein [Alphaproteobacteria bacterium]|nr:OpgC domain-containing protein [Alphaproteobacteria bacterium]